jgi:acyl-CoA thioesterase-2
VTAAPTSEIFTDAVTLKPVAAEHFDSAFTAVTQPVPWPKAYGGDLVAQAVVAAMRTVEEGKSLNSAHSYFMRPADIGAEVRYEVEHLRDGRGFSTRQVRAFQNGKAIYTCLASFAAGEPGQDHQAVFPADVPEPETLPSSAEYLAGRTGGTMTEASRAYWSHGRSFDMRHVPGPVYLTVEGAGLAHQAVWVRPFDRLRPVAGLNPAQRDLAALAYVCDYTILESVLRVCGLSWA